MSKKIESEQDLVELIQRIIDAAFVRYDVEHGHLNWADGEAKLAELEGEPDDTNS